MPKEFKPTQPALPRAGEPLGIEDMVKYFAQKEDRGIEGFVRPNHHKPAVMRREVTVNKRTPVARHWGFANIVRFAP